MKRAEYGLGVIVEGLGELSTAANALGFARQSDNYDPNGYRTVGEPHEVLEDTFDRVLVELEDAEISSTTEEKVPEEFEFDLREGRFVVSALMHYGSNYPEKDLAWELDKKFALQMVDEYLGSQIAAAE